MCQAEVVVVRIEWQMFGSVDRVCALPLKLDESERQKRVVSPSFTSTTSACVVIGVFALALSR
jgi:hypothetical protein